jgi:Palmitoyl protein thioesterase/Secretion system C-terminal sorting domain
MKLFTLKKHLSGIFFLYCCIISAQNQPQVEPRFKTFKDGLAFTAITVDQNKNVWAGTDKLGLFFLNQTTPTNTTFNLLSIGTAPVVSTLRIQSMAADKLGNVWIGHGGSNFSSGGGGVERVDITSNNVQHYSPDRNAKGLTFFERDGLATLNAQQVVVDDNNTVWVAHRYHDLTVVGIDPVFDPSQYILTPGAFSFKKSGADKFTSIGTWKDRSALPKLLPYPAFTYNPTPSQTPNSRVFNAISVDKTQMWTSVYGYEADSGVPNVRGPYLTARLLQSDLNGKLLFDFTKTKAKFASDAGVFNGVYANNLKGVWATSSMVNEGFSVYKNGKWINVNDPQLIPLGTRFNRAAIWGDTTGRVYMGTTNGLIVYDGYGAVGNIKSYKLYTKVAYTSPYSVLDIDMLSNNIIAGATEGKDSPNFSWIATDVGVMRCFISSDVIVYHVEDKKIPNKNILLPNINGIVDNYTKMVELKSQSPTYTPPDSDKPHFAVDGTTSSIIRYKTNDFDGFYAPNSNYKYEIKKGGIPVNVTDTLRYGKLTLKDKNTPDYKDKLLEDGSKYVDFIFRHPTYIDANDFVAGKNYVEYELFVSGKNSSGVTKTLFYHPIRFSLPPVLLTHGVWSGIDSLEYIEKALVSKGYNKEEVIKCWRSRAEDDQKAPENNYQQDVPIIHKYIDKLREQSLDNKVSVGKVNVIAHSRGGLYTRAYIEELVPGLKYYDDINSLITLNTPHFGSQNGNACLDERIIIQSMNITTGIDPLGNITGGSLDDITYVKSDPVKIKDIFSKSVPKQDRTLILGAQTLTVENDNLSKFDTKNSFIAKLNSDVYLKNLVKNKVPIHAIATNYDLCNVSNLFCGNNDFIKAFNDAKIVVLSNAWPILLAKATTFLLTDGVKFGSDFIKKDIFNNETNDFIVPNTSMKAGLDDKYVSPFTGINMSHSKLKIVGNNIIKLDTDFVVGNPMVCDRLFELLKQNFKNTDSNFTFGGITNNPLTYNLFPNFKGLSANRISNSSNISNTVSKIFIDSKSIKLDLISGETTTFDVYQENIDQITMTYQYSGIEDVYMAEKNETLGFKNSFAIDVPKETIGKFKVTATGYYLGKLVAEHTIESTVQLPANLTLQSIKFNQPEVTLPEQSSVVFNILGTYSDGIERRINDLSGITFTIEDGTVLQQADSSTLKSIVPGQSSFKATVGTLEATLDVTVEENRLLLNNIVANFFPENQSTGPITLKWNTYQEYKSKNFTLERSENNNQNFTEISNQSGKGTLYNTTTNYIYADDTNANTVFYRLKLFNTDDNEVFNQVIEVNRSTLSNENLDLSINKNELSLTPNPLKTNIGQLFMNSSFSDNDAKLSIYDLTGKLICNKSHSIKEGNQKIQFEIPYGLSNGIYLIQLKTKSYTKTIKLLLQK